MPPIPPLEIRGLRYEVWYLRFRASPGGCLGGILGSLLEGLLGGSWGVDLEYLGIPGNRDLEVTAG